MTRTISQTPRPPDYGATLNRILELAMQTAEAASAEGNQKVVIQAVREVTRIVALILKMDAPPDQGARRGSARPGVDRGLDPYPANSAAKGADRLPLPARTDLPNHKPRPATGGRPSETLSPGLETLSPVLTRDILKGMFHPLAGPEPLSLENRKREIAGKLAGKTPGCGNKNELNKVVNKY